MITKQEVKHIAKLARLDLTDQEAEQYQEEFASILNFVEKLKEADVSEAKELPFSFEFEKAVRKDEPAVKGKAEKEKISDLIPQNEDGYLKIKSVL